MDGDYQPRSLNKMAYVLLIRDEAGNVTYLNKLFDNENSAFEFTRVHRITDYEIVSEQEFQSWMQSQQQGSSQQQRSGYQQHVEIIDDQRQEQPAPRPRPVVATFKPMMFRPEFVGRKKKILR